MQRIGTCTCGIWLQQIAKIADTHENLLGRCLSASLKTVIFSIQYIGSAFTVKITDQYTLSLNIHNKIQNVVKVARALVYLHVPQGVDPGEDSSTCMCPWELIWETVAPPVCAPGS